MRANDFFNGYGFGFVRIVTEDTNPDTLTAEMRGPMKLPVAKLIQLGSGVSRQEYDNKMDPVVLTIDSSGNPSVEGMGSIMSARDAGEEFISARVEWYGGSEQDRNSMWCPAAIANLASWS